MLLLLVATNSCGHTVSLYKRLYSYVHVCRGASTLFFNIDFPSCRDVHVVCPRHPFGTEEGELERPRYRDRVCVCMSYMFM